MSRFLAIEGKTLHRSKLQLVGVAAMFLVSKIEEVYAPAVSDFVYITDNAYTEAEIRQMELRIIRALEFDLCQPIALNFLRSVILYSFDTLFTNTVIAGDIPKLATWTCCNTRWPSTLLRSVCLTITSSVPLDLCWQLPPYACHCYFWILLKVLKLSGTRPCRSTVDTPQNRFWRWFPSSLPT